MSFFDALEIACFAASLLALLVCSDSDLCLVAWPASGATHKTCQSRLLWDRTACFAFRGKPGPPVPNVCKIPRPKPGQFFFLFFSFFFKATRVSGLPAVSGSCATRGLFFVWQLPRCEGTSCPICGAARAAQRPEAPWPSWCPLVCCAAHPFLVLAVLVLLAVLDPWLSACLARWFSLRENQVARHLIFVHMLSHHLLLMLVPLLLFFSSSSFSLFFFLVASVVGLHESGLAS